MYMSKITLLHFFTSEKSKQKNCEMFKLYTWNITSKGIIINFKGKGILFFKVIYTIFSLNSYNKYWSAGNNWRAIIEMQSKKCK